MLNQLIVTSVAAGAPRPRAARRIALAKPPQFHIMNTVNLIGFIGKDAVVRTGNNGNFTTLELATKTSYKDKESGEYKSRTEWHNCIVFGKRSEFAATLKKGAHIFIEGEMQHTEYESKKTKTTQQSDSVRVTSIQKLDRSAKATSEEQDAEEIPEEVEAE